ncbi:MAG: EAL domain-containing protein [Burkholderiales bacterium]
MNRLVAGNDKLFDAIAAAIPDGLIIIDERGVILAFNPGAEHLFGYMPREAIGQNVSLLMPSPHRAEHDGYLARYLTGGVKHIIGIGREVIGRHKNGHTFPVYLSVGEADYAQGRVFIGIVHDLTEFKRTKDEAQQAEALRHLNTALKEEVARRERTEQALSHEKERYQVTLASIGEGVISTDAHGRIVFLNPVAEQLTGWPSKEALGQNFSRVFRAVEETTRKPLDDLITGCLAGVTTTLPENTLIVCHDGEERVVEDALSPIRSASGEAIGCVLTFRDVTGKRDAARHLAHQAAHDSLTGLVNRGEFERRLKRVLESRAPHETHALLYLDLDQFKIVNDTCGHVAGDELLRQIAALLQSHVRKRDTLARLGGDEFGALLEHCSLDQAKHVAEQLRRAVQEFKFFWNDHEFNIGVSIGLVPVTEATGALVEIMGAADSACYVAKEHGRNSIHTYHVDDRTLAERTGQMRWIPRIRRALAEHRFRLEFQPIVSLSSPHAGVEHVEALLRMIDENGGVIAPDVFIPAAERFDQMLDVDQWVIEHLVDAIRSCPPNRCPSTIGVNISAQSLCDKRFLPFVVGQLGKSDDDVASRLCFEITETAAIINYRHAQEFIAELRGSGCRFALDDFGTGLSSFSHIKNLHVDFIKIDGRFIGGMLGDAVDRAVVKAIHQIASAIDIKTIAEFVEDERTAAELRNIGVQFAQGWYFGRPRAIDALLKNRYQTV